MKHLINLERLKIHLTNKFKMTLVEIDDFLQSFVFRREIKELRHKEVDLVLKKSKKTISVLLINYVTDLAKDWTDLYDYQYKLETGSKPKLPKPVMKQPLKLSANVGITLDDILKNFSEQESKKITDAIRYAHAKGLSNQELVKIIRGTKARRYEDGILATTTRQAKTIAHTGTAVMASQAKQQVIEDNKDIIKGIKVLATLDLRTSGICRHLDGEFMTLDKAVYPPYHYNCRSSFEIVYDGYEAPQKRASMNGPVENQTYYEWLKDQPKAYQEEVFGKKKAELFRKSSVKDFKEFDKSLRPMTLDEMKALL